MSERDNEIEELVLKESILSASGLNSDSLQIGIKGDPSLRETTFDRKKYHSTVDSVFDELELILKELLLNRSTYRIYIGFNNGEIRTHSIFDPLRQEVHQAEKMADWDYVRRQFPEVGYEDKIAFVQDIYTGLSEHPIYEKLPSYWQNIMHRRNKKWQPMEKSEITNVLSTLRVLRDMPEYYLRNVTVCTVQSVVHMQFNCDGTQLISAENYQRFLEENLVSAWVKQ